ncbi:hypothetical protein M378DRAFT_158883 [Amanita muscaria Koide BX008]|uniref:SSD domain-containing protein n=1 Tax=Amanita muscaria (strain Koide BX008) TaxID=946122 RepID=A0A0C2XHB5_AMAMK|nr:hypothetical protein M378DRAFT_158883 [Amanita muscaria Koide BX008]
MTGNTGRCAMRGSCGKKGFFGKSLPCPYDGPPQEPDDRKTQRLLAEVCGPSFAQGPVCCTSEQVEELRVNFNQVEGLISSCPACRNNFRSFFCTFTCSPNQGTFLNVTSTQTTQSEQIAVKSVDFHVTSDYGEGFFNSCKSVQVGATNGYAMDLIGGGAKDYHSFLAYMGEEKPIGSPFQIDFPLTAPASVRPLNDTPRNCSDNDLGSRCTCIDCPAICPTLPDVPPPGAEDNCKVGPISCLTFFLLLAYLVATLAFLTGYSIRGMLKKRQDKTYDRVALSVDTASPRSHSRGLIGAGSLARYVEEDSIGALSESRRLGRETSLLDPVETVQPRHYPLNSFLRRAFYRTGLFAATSPWLTFTIALMVMGSLNFGWKFFEVETDPVQLWVAPDSESKLQKEFFDENFGPFYRTEQIFATAASPPYNSSIEDDSLAENPVLSWERLKYWFNVESNIRSLRSSSGYTLSDICFKPAGTGPCVVQSIMGWFGNDLDDYSYDTWAERVKECALRPVECLPDYQQPLAPEFLLGGVPLHDDGTKDYINAEAFVVTYVVSNSLDSEVQARAMEWERALREYLLNLKPISFAEAGLEITFSTGVSLEEEINKSTNTDVRTVVLSYLAMFLYVSFALGQNSGSRQDNGVVLSLLQWARDLPLILWRRRNPSVDSRPPLFPRLPRSMFTESRVMLSLFGICLVILSISSTVGSFSFVGVKVTLVIAEVIPFLVLAVGVDNVFILVHELDRQTAMHGPNAASGTTQEEHRSTPLSPARSTVDSLRDGLSTGPLPLYVSAEERVARALANMGPSILLSGVTETVAFALGALVPMPAVRNFALYAAGSVLLNAILQVTVFVSALSLDLRRSEARRVDCFPCIKLPQRIELVDATPSPGIGRLAMFMRRYYAPFLLQPLVKILILLIFAGLAVLSVISMQHIQLGLDQRLALPSDSYLVDYFDDLDAFFDVGPPLYFVARDVNVTRRPGQQALCGRFTTCTEFSVANLLELERNRPESSFISEPGASWIDDFLGWLDPAKEQCCRVRKADPTTFCRGREPERLCQPCYYNKVPAWNITMNGLPEGGEFMRYLKQWIISPTTEDCPLAGKASFANALSFGEDGDTVFASNFRSFHSPLKSQSDFINAFEAAHRIAREMSQHSGADIFPYSLFYVFFEQYAHIIAITREVLGLGLAAVLATTALLLGSWRAGMIVTTVVALIVINVMGVMAVWGINLNAISLVNLVISLGIAVEFCAHIARAFVNAGSGLPLDHPAAQKERDERVWASLVEIGPSVLSGITFTKLIGMSVLALTRSRLLEIYYFRMWLTLILSGALHGLVLLPVILSIAGGQGTPHQEADEEWMSNAIRSGYEYPPFLADDDDTNLSDT